MKKFQIFFKDLNDEAKKEYLMFRGVESESDLNSENSPLATIENWEDENDADQ